MPLQKITDTILFDDNPGPMSANSCAVDLGEYVVVIDTTFSPQTAELYRNEVEKAFKRRVDAVLITHHHADHFFGAQTYMDCNLLMSTTEVDHIKKLLKTRWSKENLERYKQNDPLAQGLLSDLEIMLPHETFNIEKLVEGTNQRLIINAIGGHSSGIAIAYIPESEVIIATDNLMTNRFPWGDSSSSLQDWITSLEYMKQWNAEVIIPGHGKSADMEMVDRYLAFFSAAEDVVKRVIQEHVKMEDLQNIIKRDVPEFLPAKDFMEIEKTFQIWIKNYNERR